MATDNGERQPEECPEDVRSRGMQDPRYADLPLPAAWLPTLERLRREPPSAKPFSLPAVTKDLQSSLVSLPVRERFVLERRWIDGWTLDETGRRLPKPVTRQRVEQIEKQALNALIDACPSLVSGIVSWFEPKAEPWIRLVQVSDSQVGLAEALAAVLQRVLDSRFKLTKLASDLWSLESAADVPTARKSLGASLKGEHFYPRPWLEDQIGSESWVLDTLLVRFHEDVHVTRDQHICLRSMTIPQLIVAVARELAIAGFTDFHGSEMAKALAFIAPDQFGGIPSHQIFSCITQSRLANRFSHTGRRGRWQLVEHGDGARNNLEAVLATFGKHKCALHWMDVHAHLQREGRNVSDRTVYALLFTTDTIDALGGGIFMPNGGARTCAATEQWLLRQLAPGVERTVKELWPQAVSAGIDPLRIRGTAAASENLIYTRGGNHHPPRVTRRATSPEGKAVADERPRSSSVEAGLQGRASAGESLGTSHKVADSEDQDGGVLQGPPFSLTGLPSDRWSARFQNGVLRSLRFSFEPEDQVAEVLEVALAHPLAQQLEELALFGMSRDVTASLLRSDRSPGLRRLAVMVHGERVGAADLREVARRFPALESLGLFVEAPEFDFDLLAGTFPRIRRLDLAVRRFGGKTLAAVAALPMPLESLGLELLVGQSSLADFTPYLGCEAFPGLRELGLFGGLSNRPALVKKLASSARLTKLGRLGIWLDSESREVAEIQSQADAFAHVVLFPPDSFDAHQVFRFAEVLVSELGRPRDAVVAALHGLELHPRHARMWLLLARCRAMLGEREPAIRALANALVNDAGLKDEAREDEALVLLGDDARVVEMLR